MNSVLNVCGLMAFNLFFTFFGNGVQGRFEKGIPCLDKCPFDFCFLLYEQLNRERYASIWRNSFLWKIAVNIQNSDSKNSGCIIDVNRISVFRGYKIMNLLL